MNAGLTSLLSLAQAGEHTSNLSLEEKKDMSTPGKTGHMSTLAEMVDSARIGQQQHGAGAGRRRGNRGASGRPRGRPRGRRMRVRSPIEVESEDEDQNKRVASIASGSAGGMVPEEVEEDTEDES